jgi:flagellar motor switch protein FliN/FliY
MEDQALLPEPETGLFSNSTLAQGVEITGEAALVPTAHSCQMQDGLQLNPTLARLAVELDVAIPFRDFRVRDLVALEAGQVIETQWRQEEEMPLSARGAQLAWTKFELIESRLAVRVTRLA